MRPSNPELQPLRVYDEEGMIVICVKRQPSLVVSPYQLSQLQSILNSDPGLLNIANYLVRELGEDAPERLKEASRKCGIGLTVEDTGSCYGV